MPSSQSACGWAAIALGAVVGVFVSLQPGLKQEDLDVPTASEMISYIGDSVVAASALPSAAAARGLAAAAPAAATSAQAAPRLRQPAPLPPQPPVPPAQRNFQDHEQQAAQKTVLPSSSSAAVVEEAAAPPPAEAPAALAEEEPLEPEKCLVKNSARSGHELEGALKVASLEKCQSRCRCIEGCFYYTYWPDGNCHAQSKEASLFSAGGAKTGQAFCRASATASAATMDASSFPNLPRTLPFEVSPVEPGPRLYVYDLPAKFRNGGKDPECFTADCVFGGPPENVFGADIWSSNQFSMPRMLYYRFMTSPRRTTKLEEADVFLIPAYSSKPSEETPCADNQELYNALFELNPLLRNKKWVKEKGSRHLFADARGHETCNYMWNMTLPWRLAHRVNIELNGMYSEGPEGWTIGKPFFWYQFPYPAVYHGSAALTPAKLRTLGHAKYLWSFAGTDRRGKIAGHLRGTLMHQCNRCESCGKVTSIAEVNGEIHQAAARDTRKKAWSDYAKLSALKLQSTFCVEPPGDTITRKGLVDSIVLGCIPVVFEHQELDMYEPFINLEEFAEAVVYVPEAQVVGNTVPLSLWGKGPKPSQSVFRKLKQAYPQHAAVFEAIAVKNEGGREKKMKALFPHAVKMAEILRNISAEEVHRRQKALAVFADRLVIATEDGGRDALRILLDKIMSNDEAAALRSQQSQM